MAFKMVIVQADQYFGLRISKVFDEHGFGITVVDVSDQASFALTEHFEHEAPSLVVLTSLVGPIGLAEHLVGLCQQYAVPLLALSSHHVFGLGKTELPRFESDVPEPKDSFGSQLKRMEAALLLHDKTIVLRLPWIVDDASVPLLFHLCDSMLNGGKVMVSDQWRGCPVDTRDVCRVVLAITLQVTCGANNWGIYHLHSNDECSEAEFADYVRRVLVKAGCDQLASIVTVPFEHRFFASNGWLGGVRLTNDFGIQLRSWRQGIKTKVMQWLSEQVDLGRVELHPTKKEERPAGS